MDEGYRVALLLCTLGAVNLTVAWAFLYARKKCKEMKHMSDHLDKIDSEELGNG